MIEVQLPDGTVKEYPASSSAHDVAASIGDRLAGACIAAEVNGTIVDLHRPLPEEGRVVLRLLTDRCVRRLPLRTASRL